MKDDFPDWQSPMVVKEVRQTLRSRRFAFPFLIFHGLLALVAISGISLQSEAPMDVTGGFFWALAGLLLLVLVPASGLNAIPAEAKGNTLELLFMSRLTAWRIIVGKWIGMAGQALIVFFSMIPYAVLRYFLGGVAILDDMRNLLAMLGGSLVLSAIAIALSAYLAIWLRILVVIGALFLLQATGVYFLSRSFGGGGLPAAHSGWIEAASWIVGGGLLLLLGLVFAAARIAPPAENHAWRKRLPALVLTGFLAVALAKEWTSNVEAVLIVATLVLLFVCADAVLEPVKRLPVLFLPIGPRNWIGRVGSWMFSPGWVSGCLFTTLVFTTLWLVPDPGITTRNDRLSAILFGLAVTGALSMPLALYRSFFRHARQPLAIFIGFHAVSAVVAVLISVFARNDGTIVMNVFSFIPLCAVISAVGGPDPMSGIPLCAAAVGFSLVVIAVHFAREAPQVLALQRAALELRPPEGSE